MSANLPLDAVLAERPTRPLLCLAVDLLPLAGPRPRTIGAATCRSQDLMFATQSRRALAAWPAILAALGEQGTSPAITIVHQPYADQGREVSGKALDFFPAAIRDRWDTGHRDTAGVLDAIADARLPFGEPGLHVYNPEGGPEGERSLAAVRHRMEPQPISQAARRFG